MCRNFVGKSIEMTKTILCPTDFTSESLNLVRQAIQDHADEKFNLVLLHGIHQSDSITDLLYFSKGKVIAELSNPIFDKEIEVLKARFAENINSFRLELFSGFTQRAFDRLLTDLQIEVVYLPRKYNFQLPRKSSMPLTRYLDRNPIRKVQVYWSGYDPISPETATQISPV